MSRRCAEIAACRLRRRNAGAVQRFDDVDVAEPSDDALIQQRRFDRRLLVRERAFQIRLMKLIAERLRPHRLEEGMRVEFALRDQIHVAEAARIVELKPRALLHLDHDMRVRGIVGSA